MGTPGFEFAIVTDFVILQWTTRWNLFGVGIVWNIYYERNGTFRAMIDGLLYFDIEGPL